jgi:PAS domain S-box-containing protein
MSMIDQVRSHDWAATPLGPMHAWPQALRTAVDIALGSRHPMFVAWGPSLTFVFNDAYAPLLGTRAPTALGMPFQVLWRDIWPDIEPLVEVAMGGGATWSEDLPLVMTRNGFAETAYFTFSYSPVRDESGGIGGMFCAVTETTAKVVAEAALRDSEARFRNMAEHAPVMIWVTDPEGACTYVNREWRAMTGQSEAEALGFGWLDATHPDDRAGATDAFLRANGARAPFGIEYRLRRADGAYRWVVDAAAPRFGGSGQFLGYIGSVVDLTERREIEQALREAAARKDEFIAMLAHELRNPLAPLANALALLRRTGTPSEVGAAMLELAHRQCRQLGRLVDDLLEASRITRGLIELKPRSVDLALLARQSVEARMSGIEEKAQTIDCRFPDGPATIVADPARIVQVLDNLIANAQKFTPHGGRIWVELQPRDRGWELAVRDDGVGIELQQQGRLFEMFSQIDATLERSQGGLGIGLALVRRLVELHGGTVVAHSDGTGRGSTFRVWLPGPGGSPADA